MAVDQLLPLKEEPDLIEVKILEFYMLMSFTNKKTYYKNYG